MQRYDFHIHGKPYSHDIWKNDAYSDYFNSMYSNAYLNALPDESYMIIEIHNKIAHYTYMRGKGIRDNAEREGSFFAVTVSFKEQYCSVIALYDLLDQIYNKIAKPSFFAQSKIGGCIKYKVLQLEDANVAEQMLMAFDKNVMYLDLKDMNYQFDTLHSKETKIVSLKDVDSPEFMDMLLRNRIAVSPILNSAVKRFSAIESELVTIKTQKQSLLSSNEQLRSEIATLTEENKSLSGQLHNSAFSTEKKYKSRLLQLQNELASITNERDSLKQKIEEATNSIELIDLPFQKLTRLMAGRFPENSSQKYNDNLEKKQTINAKPQTPVWREWLNSILLGIVFVCCVITLVFVLRYQNNSNTVDNNSKSKTAETPVEVYSNNQIMQSSSEQSTEEDNTNSEDIPSYDSWDECIINIKGGGDKLKLDKEYSLSITKGGNPANIPSGYWNVYINKGEQINHDNTFIIKNPEYHGKEIIIEYLINEKTVKQRVCKIR